MGLLPSSTLNNLKRIFKTEETRFIVSVGLKVTAISFGITLFIYYFIFQVMRLNYAFFKSQGFSELKDSSLFYQYLLREALETIPVLFIFHICLFFIGVYLGWIILRPFRVIGEYCELVLEDENFEYKTEEFSTYKLLTRFSEFFFEYLRYGRKNGVLTANSIPPQYSRIHKPVADKIFMLHFGILLVIISICSSLFIIENSSVVFGNMIELATKTLKDYKAINQYFAEQAFIQNEIIYLTITLITILYLMLGLHLYAKVSGAAFGIFSTMRSFMKGNFNSRVHLVGYAHVRDYTRKLNKYLDYIENNLVKGKPKG